MTNNTDDFEQDEFQDLEEPKAKPGLMATVAEAWHTKPIFKLLVIMITVGVAASAALGAFSSPPEPTASNVVAAPELHEAPGGKASPYFVEQNKQANAQRANQALQEGGSAMPTPVGNTVDIDDLTNPNKKDPLMEFRAETDRLKEEMKQQQVQQQQQMQGLQQQVQLQQREPEDNTLAQAMQTQMRQLMDGWAPRNMKVVAGATKSEAAAAATKVSSEADAYGANASAQLASAKTSVVNDKALVAAGTVNYAQLLTEANSDIQAPILAQILSGPLSGGRAVGRFQVMNDYLVMEFTLVSLKGKDYTVDAIALDPNTTLSGMATEVDHRYFTRILLPAAGAFLSSFGSAMSDSGSTTSVSDGTVIVTKAKQGWNDAVYAGIGQAGNTAAQFFQNEAQNTKTLVRVAVGTPMGLFFLQSVKDPAALQAQQAQQQSQYNNQTMGGSLAGAYTGQNGASGYSVIGGSSNNTAQTINNNANAYNPYATNNPYATTGYGTNTRSGYTTMPTSSGVYTTTRY